MKALGKGSLAAFIRIGLTVAWWALWIAAGILSLITIGYVVTLILVQNGLVDPEVLLRMVKGIEISFAEGASATLRYDEPGSGSWQLVVPALLIGGVAVGGSIIIVGRLRKLFDSFTTGDPFRRENAVHLRVIWITMVAIELSRYVLMGLAAILLLQFRDPNITELSVELEGERLSAWGSILVLIVLAEVFREGARLKEEQELTI